MARQIGPPRCTACCRSRSATATTGTARPGPSTPWSSRTTGCAPPSCPPWAAGSPLSSTSPRPRTAVREPGVPARQLRAQRRLVLRRHRVEHRRHRPHHPVLLARARGPRPRPGRRGDAPPLGVGAAARPALPGRPVAAGRLRLPPRRRADPQPARAADADVLVVQHRRPRGLPRPRPRRGGVSLRLRAAPAPRPRPRVRRRRPHLPAEQHLRRRLLLRGPRTTRRRWIAALDADGRGLVQTSTDTLRGRKLFVWGRGPGGRSWQQWLTEPGTGGYCEIKPDSPAPSWST